jgi:uncharacterized protein with HEPN domain
MLPEEQDAAHLWDMLDAARCVRDFVAGRALEEYRNDRFLRSAVERQVEIIGEAARRVSDSFRAAHPQIPWGRIIAQRHVLAHEYGEILHDRIWIVATVHVPKLIVELERLMPPLPPEGG